MNSWTTFDLTCTWSFYFNISSANAERAVDVSHPYLTVDGWTPAAVTWGQQTSLICARLIDLVFFCGELWELYCCFDGEVIHLVRPVPQNVWHHWVRNESRTYSGLLTKQFITDYFQMTQIPLNKITQVLCHEYWWPILSTLSNLEGLQPSVIFSRVRRTSYTSRLYNETHLELMASVTSVHGFLMLKHWHNRHWYTH